MGKEYDWKKVNVRGAQMEKAAKLYAERHNSYRVTDAQVVRTALNLYIARDETAEDETGGC